MKTDPRIRRTKQRLHEALLQLSMKLGYDAVSVQEVLEHSETARSTFYAHFRDKDDLLLSGFQEHDGPFFDAHVDTEDSRSSFANFIHALFDHIYQHKILAKAFSKTGLVTGHFRNLILVKTRKLVNRHLAAEGRATPDELSVQFVAGASFSLLIWWIEHDFPYSVQEMSNACQKFMISGLTGTPIALPELGNECKQFIAPEQTAASNMVSYEAKA
jgi:AcrR family transcriptional regulator